MTFIFAFFIITTIQGVLQLVDITAGDDFLGLCDQKSLCKHVSDFGQLRSYDHLKLRIEGNDYTSQQDFGTRKVYCVSNVTFHTESKYAI